MLEFISDPVVVAALITITGLVSGASGFVLGKMTPRIRSKTQALSQPLAVSPPESEQAVTEFEVIEALSTIGVAGETLRCVKDNIKTVAQLKSTVHQLEQGNLQLLQEKAHPLALDYAARILPSSGRHQACELAKAILIAQFSTGKLVVHPAFKSLEERMLAMSPTGWKSLSSSIEEKIQKQAPGNSHGPWVNLKFAAEADKAFSYRDDYPNPDRQYRPYASDFLAPGENGNIRIDRKTHYSRIGARLSESFRVSSDWMVMSYDASASEDERPFWIAVAKTRIARLINPSVGDPGFLTLGSLLEWSEFLRVLESKNTSKNAEQKPDAVRTSQNGGDSEDVSLEQLVTLKAR